MSTPINPNQPQQRQPQGAPSGPPQPQGAPTGRPGMQPLYAGGPGGGVLDSAAPTHARLPKRLGDAGKSTPIGFGQLLVVELRKLTDTRAGTWLMAITALLIVLASALVAYTERDGVKFFDLIGATLIPMNYLVPILGILAVTSEWSQRTGLITFTLEPRRGRVVLAKLAATLLAAVAATIVALAVAAGLTLLVGSLGSGDADWHMKGTAYATLFAYMLLQAGMGVAFGLLIQNTPGAICAFLFIPIVVSLFNLAGEWGQKAAEWVNPQQSMAPLIDGSVSGDQWGKLAVTLALWLVLPMVLGFVRLTKREVKSA